VTFAPDNVTAEDRTSTLKMLKKLKGTAEGVQDLGSSTARISLCTRIK
jgi:hypothetical protein